MEYQYCAKPVMLNLNKLLKTNPPNFKYHIDHFKFIIGEIIKVHCVHKGNIDKPFISLNSVKMQKRLRNYNHCLKYLIDRKIVETDGQYIVGQKSTGYRIAATYLEKGIELDVIRKKTMIKQNRVLIEKNVALMQRYEYLTKWFDGLEIDLVSADTFLKNYFSTPRNVESNSNPENSQIMKLAFHKYVLEMFAKKQFHFTTDTTINRFYSNLVHIKSELRQFVSFKGQRLCCIDVKNSQPFISMALFERNFYKKTETCNHLTLAAVYPELYNSIQPLITSILLLLPPPSTIMLVNNYNSLDDCKTDIEEFCFLVDKGKLYEAFSEIYKTETGAELDPALPEDRRVLKKMFFQSLYSDNRWFGNPDANMKRLFAKRFPNVYKVFSLLKRGNKADLSVVLQRIESEVMIRRAAVRISQQKPELPIFTIHDSIVSLEGNEEYVRSVIKEEFLNAIGCRPNLHVETWGS